MHHPFVVKNIHQENNALVVDRNDISFFLVEVTGHSLRVTEAPIAEFSENWVLVDYPVSEALLFLIKEARKYGATSAVIAVFQQTMKEQGLDWELSSISTAPNEPMDQPALNTLTPPSFDEVKDVSQEALPQEFPCEEPIQTDDSSPENSAEIAAEVSVETSAEPNPTQDSQKTDEQILDIEVCKDNNEIAAEALILQKSKALTKLAAKFDKKIKKQRRLGIPKKHFRAESLKVLDLLRNNMRKAINAENLNDELIDLTLELLVSSGAKIFEDQIIIGSTNALKKVLLNDVYCLEND